MNAWNALGLALIVFLPLTLAGCMGKSPERIASDALNKTDPAICEKISDQRMRFNCTMSVAVNIGNISLCQGIGSEEWRNDCISQIAKGRRNVTVCDAIGSSVRRDSCYRQVAGN